MNRNTPKLLTGVTMVLVLLASAAGWAHEPAKYNAREQWWWDASWWEQGALEPVANHKVRTEWINYKSGDNEIRAMVARPADTRKYPGILFVHGRRGLDDLIQAKVRRLAARGLVVVAPDIYGSRFMDPLPYEHDYTIEDDVANGVPVVLKRKDISSRKTCLVSHTRGGYYTLKAAVTKKAQEKGVACYVSWYPHMQDPNAPEPSQVYGYAPEADELKVPALIFIGEDEQYQRRRAIESATKSLKEKNRDATLVIYPGVGRGFDFRPDNVRTFADDLASKDANQRAAAFIYKHLR
ncbi:MAG: dienelactone hydrolase family protein [Gammaproteobacteria bacterium]|nr:dienelactone hydrolase family protein [Gammaproteobacteria bacterium]